MASSRIQFNDVMWNTAWTFGVTLASGATTWVIITFAENYWGRPKKTFKALYQKL